MNCYCCGYPLESTTCPRCVRASFCSCGAKTSCSCGHKESHKSGCLALQGGWISRSWLKIDDISGNGRDLIGGKR